MVEGEENVELFEEIHFIRLKLTYIFYPRNGFGIRLSANVTDPKNGR